MFQTFRFAFDRVLCLSILILRDFFKKDSITFRMAINPPTIELPVIQLNLPDHATMVGIPVDLRTVPPDMVVPNNTEDPPGVNEEGNGVVVQQDLQFERQPGFVFIN